MRRQHIHMAIFPALEASLFGVAVLQIPQHPLFAIGLGLLTAAALNFTLHITVHYHVHFKSRFSIVNELAQMGFSILIGLPFHYYQMLHINHHVYDNRPGDFTSTWKALGDRIVQRNAVAYSLLWPFRGRARHQVRAALAEGYIAKGHPGKMRRQGIAVLTFVALLAWLDWRYVILYYGIFYVGWSLISLHNYGQHLPHQSRLELGNSFYSGVYNWIFVNNGLHYEHHRDPQVPYWDLLDRRDENRNNEWPHTVDGVRFTIREEKDSVTWP